MFSPNRNQSIDLQSKSIDWFLQDLSEIFHKWVTKSQAMGLKRNHMLTKKIPVGASGLKIKLAY